MKKILINVLILLILFVFGQNVYSEDALLKGSVSAVPKNFFGVWRVSSVLSDTDSPAIFKENGVDLWNIYSSNNVIYLSNPFSGASAQVEISKVEGKNFIFTKNGRYNNKLLTDTVSITISGDSFVGTDELELKTVSDVTGEIIKTENAKYKITGEKLSE